MTKVIIQEKFNTSFGLVINVKNDRTFKVNDIIETEEGTYKINKIMFSSRPHDDDSVNLAVS